GALCPSDTADHEKSRRCRLGHVISCVQSQLISLCPDDQCGSRRATCQCPSVPAVSAHQCQQSVLISASSQCSSVPAVSAHQCQQSVLISATCQCPSVPHASAYQCTSMPHISAHLSCLSMSPSVPVRAACQCQSV
ncbi:unnamed protein product, partial [Staurois parvus]